jgi:hypothetical protein
MYLLFRVKVNGFACECVAPTGLSQALSFRNTFIPVDGGIMLEPEQLMVSMFE